MSMVLAVIALLVALAALGGALVTLSDQRRASRDRAERERVGAAGVDLPEDTRALREEVAALREEAADAMRHVAVVRYDAFADVGGQLSWSMALVDDAGNGVLLTAIHGRSEARTYAKGLTAWVSDQQLSPEEEQAVGDAQPR